MTATLTAVDNPPGGACGALQWVGVTLEDRTARVVAIAGGRIAVRLQDWARPGRALSRAARTQRKRRGGRRDRREEGAESGQTATGAAFPSLRVTAKMVMASAALPPPPTTQSSDGPFHDPARGGGGGALTNDMFTQGAANDMFTQVETQEAEPVEQGGAADAARVEQSLFLLTHVDVCA